VGSSAFTWRPRAARPIERRPSSPTVATDAPRSRSAAVAQAKGSSTTPEPRSAPALARQLGEALERERELGDRVGVGGDVGSSIPQLPAEVGGELVEVGLILEVIVQILEPAVEVPEEGTGRAAEGSLGHRVSTFRALNVVVRHVVRLVAFRRAPPPSIG